MLGSVCAIDFGVFKNKFYWYLKHFHLSCHPRWCFPFFDFLLSATGRQRLSQARWRGCKCVFRARWRGCSLSLGRVQMCFPKAWCSLPGLSPRVEDPTTAFWLAEICLYVDKVCGLQVPSRIQILNMPPFPPGATVSFSCSKRGSWGLYSSLTVVLLD